MPEIRFQEGPQEQFLRSKADIAIIGGANDGGKTFGLLMDSIYYKDNPGYEAVYFRRITSEITNAGGLWREARKIFHNVEWRESPRMQVKFRSGASLTFSHMEHPSDRFSWDGAQIAGLYFDQLESFEEEQFWHLVGRNRSTSGVKPFVRASMNPPGGQQPEDHWLAKFLQWWWDKETGYFIEERNAKLRWFARDPNSDTIHWANTPEELSSFTDSKTGEPVPPKSVTFIFASVYDNKAALALDPGRLTNLLQLPFVERERRLRGNMKIQDITGDGLIKPEWWKRKMISPEVWRAIQERLLTDYTWRRGWDLAAGDSAGADYTVGVLVGKHRTENKRIIANVVRGKWTPGARNEMLKATIKSDEKFDAMSYIWKPTMNNDMTKSVTSALAGLPYQLILERGSKLYRAQSFSAQVEAGTYFMVEAEWNTAAISEYGQFTGEPSDATRKDDITDATSLADKMATDWG